jgi:desumoylating isopeptidase 1
MIDGVFTRPPQQAIPPPIKPSRQAQPSISAAQAQPNIQYPSSISEFNSIISSWKMAIAFFTSETCGPCKMIEPYFHSLSKSHTNIKFILVDIGRNYALAQAHNITATPTFQTFLNGQQLTEWKGANQAALNQNLTRLIDSSRPSLPPSLRGHYSQSPILFPRSPPMQKVLSQLPDKVFPKPLLQSISTFLAKKEDTHVLVPPLSNWAEMQRNLDYDLENAWMVVDLLRAAMADKRVSGWFAVDGLSTIADIVKRAHARDEKEWQLRVVTIQLVYSKICHLTPRSQICFQHP